MKEKTPKTKNTKKGKKGEGLVAVLLSKFECTE
jgi:hypothetical protein